MLEIASARAAQGLSKTFSQPRKNINPKAKSQPAGDPALPYNCGWCKVDSHTRADCNNLWAAPHSRFTTSHYKLPEGSSTKNFVHQGSRGPRPTANATQADVETTTSALATLTAAPGILGPLARIPLCP